MLLEIIFDAFKFTVGSDAAADDWGAVMLDELRVELEKGALPRGVAVRPPPLIGWDRPPLICGAWPRNPPLIGGLLRVLLIGG